MVLKLLFPYGWKYPPFGRVFFRFFRYKVRAFLAKSPTKFGQFINELLTKIFYPFCRRVGGGFDN